MELIDDLTRIVRKDSITDKDSLAITRGIGRIVSQADTIESLTADNKALEKEAEALQSADIELFNDNVSLAADKAELVKLLSTIKKYGALREEFETLVVETDEAIAKHQESKT